MKYTRIIPGCKHLCISFPVVDSLNEGGLFLIRKYQINLAAESYAGIEIR